MDNIIIYNTDDGAASVKLYANDGTVWMTQAQMAELFQCTRPNVNAHLQTIYKDGELDEKATCKKFLQVRQEGTRSVKRELPFYSLDAILAVGFRVRSPRGTQFRRWANTTLKEYLQKGFVIDDERLKTARPGRMPMAGCCYPRRQEKDREQKFDYIVTTARSLAEMPCYRCIFAI